MHSDDDYMSDKYLQSDIRSSLIKDYAKKRKLKMEFKQLENIKKQREINLEQKNVLNIQKLNQSLQKPIEANNKGFQLLTKMGFKPGQSLGKNTSKSKYTKASTEPITISIKNDRGGFGRDTALKQLAEKNKQILEERYEKQLGNKTEDFRKRFVQRTDEHFEQKALSQCQITCENLDFKSNIQSPEILWFWPERNNQSNSSLWLNDEQNEKDEKEDVEEFTNSEKIEILTNYLRISYNFCFWCGINYANSKDLGDNCPGLTREDH